MEFLKTNNKKSAKLKYIKLFVLLNLASRAPLIFWGLPAIFISTEYFISKQVFYIAGKFTLIPLNFIYPTFYYYFLTIVYAFHFLIGYIAGIYENQYHFVAQYLINPTFLIATSRAFSLVLFAATSLVWWKWYKRNNDYLGGKIFIILWLTASPLLIFSFIQVPDMLLLFLESLAIINMFHYFGTGKVKYIYRFAFLTGLTISTKYNAGFLAVMLFGMVLELKRKNKSLQNSLRVLFKSLFILFFAFFLGTPGWIFQFSHFYQGFWDIVTQNFSITNPVSSGGWLGFFILLLTHSKLFFIIIIVGVISLFSSHYMNKNIQIAFLLFILPTIFVILLFQKQSLDYLFPIFPILIWSCVEFIKWNYKQYRKAIQFFVFLLLIQYVIDIIPYYHKDTRTILSEWILRNKSSIHSVVYDHYHFDLAFFDLDRYLSRGASSDKLPEKIKKFLLNYRNDKRNLNIYPLLHLDSITYKSMRTKNHFLKETLSLKAYSPRELDSLGIDIIILNGEEVKNYFNWKKIKNKSKVIEHLLGQREFWYKRLLRQKPVLKIKNGFWKTGPELIVFKLGDKESSND